MVRAGDLDLLWTDIHIIVEKILKTGKYFLYYYRRNLLIYRFVLAWGNFGMSLALYYVRANKKSLT